VTETGAVERRQDDAPLHTMIQGARAFKHPSPSPSLELVHGLPSLGRISPPSGRVRTTTVPYQEGIDMEPDGLSSGASPSQLIDARIEELGDWRGVTLGRLRSLILEADSDVVEEWKWRGVPVWYHDGMICTGETYKSVVKVTFAKGAALKDPAGLFNSSLDGNVRRAIDFREGETINESAFKALIRAAVNLNITKSKN